MLLEEVGGSIWSLYHQKSILRYITKGPVTIETSECNVKATESDVEMTQK
jgi:hypothetical protein